MIDYYKKKEKEPTDLQKRMNSLTKIVDEYCVKSRVIFLLLCTFSILIIILMVSWLAVENSIADSVTVIVVPGGGLLKDGTPPPHTIKRLEKAKQLFDKLINKGTSAVIITLSAGIF